MPRMKKSLQRSSSGMPLKRTMAAIVKAVAVKSSSVKMKKRLVKPSVIRGLRNTVGSSGRIGLASSNSNSTSRCRQVIEEDEYIADINGSVAFQTTAYPINIGQSSTFPWGKSIAALYEKYDFEYLEFYYRREVSEFATNGQSGKVMLSCDYDASDPPPTSKQQVLDTVPRVDGMPCEEEIRLRLDPREMKSQDSFFVRPGLQPANTDIKTYDVGNLYVSTFGCTNSSVVGELRVKYRCRLRIPILQSVGAGSGQVGSQFILTSALAGEAAPATTVAGLMFASATNPVIVTNGINATLASTGLITVPAGTYLVESWNTTSNSTQSVSNSTNQLVTSSTLTDYVLTNGSHASVGIGTYNVGVIGSNPASVVWPTAILGTVIGYSNVTTYATGQSLNNGCLRITLL